MKKLMIMALMAAAAITALAQDVKSILKAKTYSEAQTLLQSSLASLDNESKAKAYNKLVQLSMEKINHESATISGNAVAQQLGQGKVEPYDTVGYNKAICTALKDAMECDKYDNMPNAKGKIAPKFHKKNQETLWPLRVNLINAGQDAGNAQDTKAASEYFSLYVETATDKLFADRDVAKMPDQYLGQIARFAAIYAFQDKNMEKANAYCDVALNDTASYKDALELKMYLMQQTLKTREDSVKCLSQFETLYAKDKSDAIFTNLASMYGNLGMKDKQDKLVAEKLAEDPKCYFAYAIRGQSEMNERKYDEAIADFKKAHEIDPKKSIMCTYIGACINAKAASLDGEAQKKLLEESVTYLEKARDLDPNRNEANWAYPLYQCYYSLYGESDSRTAELKGLVNQ